MFLFSLHLLSYLLLTEFWVDWYLFFLVFLKMSFHHLLTSPVSNQKSVVIQIIISLYVMCWYSLVAFKLFLFVLCFSNLIMMCLGVILLKCIMFGVYWAAWICIFVFEQTWEVFDINSLNIFFPLLSPSLLDLSKFSSGFSDCLPYFNTFLSCL